MRTARPLPVRYALLPLATCALLLSACATAPSTQRFTSYAPAHDAAPQRCFDCGTVESIIRITQGRENTRTGAVLGGVVGAIAGRALADDDHRGRQNTATVVGAVAGAVVGDAIEERRIADTFDITVRMDDGRRLTINTARLPAGLREGSYVRWDGRNLVSLR